MTTAFSYTTTYRLDKSHYSETFDESITVSSAKTLYSKSIVFALLGFFLLLFTEINPYAAWFIVGLGALEALSIRFRKSWWLTRQMISNAANTDLKLTIDEDGVSSKSSSVESQFLWADVIKIEQTTQGWLLYHAAGKNYLSDRILSEAAKEFLTAQVLLREQ